MKLVTTYSTIFLVATFGAARPVFAEPEGKNDGKCLSKLNILRTELADYQQSSRRWVNTWGITWSAATASQLIIASSVHDIETRKDLWVGSASSALGLIPTWIVPPSSIHEVSLNGDCESELSQAESLIQQLSTSSEGYNGPIAHISNVAVNLVTSLVLGLGFGHWSSAAISLAAGIPIGEVMIFTYPKFEGDLHTSPSLTTSSQLGAPELSISFEF